LAEITLKFSPLRGESGHKGEPASDQAYDGSVLQSAVWAMIEKISVYFKLSLGHKAPGESQLRG
jgi:hypothetical protein